MKTFTKYIYFLTIITMFIIFFFFLGQKYAEFKAGAYGAAPVHQEQCDEYGGLRIKAQGEDRCYVSPTEYMTGTDFGNPVVGGPTNFHDCIIAKGELIQSEFGEQCYFSKDLFFENEEKTVEPQNFSDCAAMQGQIFDSGYGRRCYISESKYFDEK